MATPSHIPANGTEWNLGYSDGYHKNSKPIGTDEAYEQGYLCGKVDRDEDDRAIESGTFDLLNEDERLELYGDESDRI